MIFSVLFFLSSLLVSCNSNSICNLKSHKNIFIKNLKYNQLKIGYANNEFFKTPIKNFNKDTFIQSSLYNKQKQKNWIKNQKILGLSLTSISSFFLFNNSKEEENTRKINDKLGYTWNPNANQALMNYLKRFDSKKILKEYPVAGICPHDDHLFAGHVYYDFFKHITAKEIIIFGVCHRSAREKLEKKGVIVLDTYKNWLGTYGKIDISPLREDIIEKMDEKYIEINNEAHANEYSLEAMIPFIQYFKKKEVKIIPIIITKMEFETMDEISDQLSEIIYNYIKSNNLQPGKDIFLLCSSDSSHYGSDFKNTFLGEGKEGHDLAIKADMEATQYLLGNLSIEKIKKFKNEEVVQKGWCGRFSIPFSLLTTEKIFQKFDNKLEGIFCKYSDTLSQGVLPIHNVEMGVTNPFNIDHWVGHLAVFYFLVP